MTYEILLDFLNLTASLSPKKWLLWVFVSNLNRFIRMQMHFWFSDTPRQRDKHSSLGPKSGFACRLMVRELWLLSLPVYSAQPRATWCRGGNCLWLHFLMKNCVFSSLLETAWASGDSFFPLASGPPITASLASSFQILAGRTYRKMGECFSWSGSRLSYTAESVKWVSPASAAPLGMHPPCALSPCHGLAV